MNAEDLAGGLGAEIEPSAIIRASIVQPAMPAYRVPAFRRLAEDPRMCLTIYSAASNEVPEATYEGFEYKVFPQLRAGHAFAWWPIEWHLAGSAGIDVLVLPWNTRILSTIPALLRARWKGVRTILWGHGMSRRRSGTVRARDRLRNLVASMASAVMVYDYQTAEVLALEFGPNRVFVAPNALDQEPMKAARAHLEADPSRERAFIDQNDLAGRDVILHVSRLIAARRLDVLLEAVPSMIIARPNTLVVIIGDGPEKQNLVNRANLLAIAQHVLFVPATYDEDLLALWFSVAKAYCFPEGLGLSIFHALGYGIPVVLGDDLERHWPETKALTVGVDAVGFRHGDSEDLAIVLINLLTDHERRSAIAAAGHELVASRYNLDRMVAGLVSALIDKPGDVRTRGRL